jgi:dihydrodipicolinate synthase/N-acetylneuraminate lyase
VEAPGLHRDSRSVGAVAQLALDIHSVVSIRVDPAAGVQRSSALRDRTRTVEHAVSVLGRLEPFMRPFDASAVPDGIVTPLAFPEIARALFDAFRVADTKAIAALEPSHATTVLLGQETDSTVIKEILRQRRIFTSSQVRHPGATADEGASRYVRNLVGAILSDADLGRVVDLTPRPFLVNI